MHVNLSSALKTHLCPSYFEVVSVTTMSEQLQIQVIQKKKKNTDTNHVSYKVLVLLASRCFCDWLVYMPKMYHSQFFIHVDLSSAPMPSLCRSYTRVTIMTVELQAQIKVASCLVVLELITRSYYHFKGISVGRALHSCYEGVACSAGLIWKCVL